MKAKNVELKIRTGMFAICSSVLTSLLSDRILTDQYIIQEKNKQTIIQGMSLSFTDMAMEYGKLLGVFFTIWLLLNIGAYIMEKVYRAKRIRKLPKIKEKEMAQILDEACQRSENLYEKIKENSAGEIEEFFIRMNLKELGSIVLLLYKNFSRPDIKGKVELKKIYRKADRSEFVSITTGISKYKLEGCLNLLQILAEDTAGVQVLDKMFEEDCKSIKKLIQEMQESLAE